MLLMTGEATPPCGTPERVAVNSQSSRYPACDCRAYRCGLSCDDHDLQQRAGCFRGYLSVDLVGRDLEQRLAGLDGVADADGEVVRGSGCGRRRADLGHRADLGWAKRSFSAGTPR